MASRKNIRKSLLSGSLLVFLVPYLILISCVTALFVRTYHADIVGDYRQRFAGLSTAIEEKFNGLSNFSVQLSNSQWMQELLLYETGTYHENPLDAWTMSSYCGNLKGLAISNDVIEEIALYLPHTNRVLTTEMVFYNWDNLLPLKPVFRSQEEWRMQMRSVNRSVLMSAVQQDLYGHHQDGILYIQTLPLWSSSPKANIVIYLSERKMAQFFKQNALQDEWIQTSIFNSAGEQIYGTNSGFVSQDRDVRFEATALSGLVSWEVVIPQSRIREQMTSPTHCLVYFVLGLCYILLLICGLSLCRRITRKHCSSLENIFNRIRALEKDIGQTVRSSDRISSDNSNEFTQIEQIIEDSTLVFKDISDQLERLRIREIEYQLTDWLAAPEMPDERLMEVLERYFRDAALVCIDTNAESLLIQQMPHRLPLFIMPMDGHTIGLTGVQGEEQFELLLQDLTQRLGGSFFAGISEALEACECARAVDQARQAFASRYLYSEPRLIRWQLPVSPQESPKQLAERLLTAVTGVNDAEITGTLEVICRWARQPDVDVYAVQDCVQRCFRTIADCAVRVGYTVKISDLRENIEQDLLQLKTLATDIAQRFDHRSRELQGRTYQEIEAFVQEQLSNPMLSLNTTAEHFGYSAAYFSSLFKRLFGQNYLDYVNKQRIEQACRMLSNTTMSIADIARQCGMASDITFRRWFKKYRGITPTDYRKNAKSE